MFFDRYNKEAAALAGTITEVVDAYNKYAKAAFIAGIAIIPYVKPPWGVPEILPAIPLPGKEDVTRCYHWNFGRYLWLKQKS